MKFYITYDVLTSMTLTVERDSLPGDKQDLIDSVTKEELINNDLQIGEIEWDSIKYAWRNADSENTWIIDENLEPLFQ